MQKLYTIFTGLLFFGAFVFAQETTIKGKVTGPNAEVLAGVNVLPIPPMALRPIPKGNLPLRSPNCRWCWNFLTSAISIKV